MAALEDRLGKHPYLNPFNMARSKSGMQTALIIFSLLAFLSGGFGFYWYRQKKLRQKVYQLSPQERKVASLLMAGKSNKEIAHELHVEVSTVKSHIYKLFNKLEINSRNEVFQYKSYLSS